MLLLLLSWSIFSGAQYATLQKYVSQPSLVIYFFAGRTELGQQIGGELLIANHLGHSETLSSS
jgi:hypothetical protein